jgi:hypothetical protein
MWPKWLTRKFTWLREVTIGLAVWFLLFATSIYLPGQAIASEQEGGGGAALRIVY